MQAFAERCWNAPRAQTICGGGRNQCRAIVNIDGTVFLRAAADDRTIIVGCLAARQVTKDTATHGVNDQTDNRRIRFTGIDVDGKAGGRQPNVACGIDSHGI